MAESERSGDLADRGHVFLGASHQQNERKTWWVIGLCALMMLVEIIGGSWYHSLALVADGWHMSTHAGAMLVVALAYGYARRHAHDPRFVFGTGKLGDLAAFSSAIVLGIIALLIGLESCERFLAPVPIRFGEAIPIATVGLLVNIISAWLLREQDHAGHSHGDAHAHAHEHRSTHEHVHAHDEEHGSHHSEPSLAQRDNNIRSAYVHVLADAAVSVLVIVGLLLARALGWLWLDPMAGMVGALVIANWSYGLARDTGRILLDVNPDQAMTARVRAAIECDGDRLADLHLWRLGPGHLAAVVSVITPASRDCAYYRQRLSQFKSLSHVTVEVTRDVA